MSGLGPLLSSLANQAIETLHSDQADVFMARFHGILAQMGFLPPYIGAGELCVAILSGVGTLGIYFICFGYRHRQSRHSLQKKLTQARDVVETLEVELEQVERQDLRLASGKEKDRPIRIWMDGAFDMSHYGLFCVCFVARLSLPPQLSCLCRTHECISARPCARRLFGALCFVLLFRLQLVLICLP